MGTTVLSADFTLRLKAGYAVVGLQLIIGLFLVIKNFWITKALLKINTPETSDNEKNSI